MMQTGKLLIAVNLLLIGPLLINCAEDAAPTAVAKATGTPRASPAAPTPTAKPEPEQPRYGGTLTRILHEDPPGFDVHQQPSSAAMVPVAPCYSSLVQYDPLDPYKIVGELAERWDISPDGKVYTFNLHKGVRFHDGKPMTAEDVQFSLDRIRKPPKGTLSPRADMLRAIDAIETPDTNTVKINLEYPFSPLLAHLAMGWMLVLPKHVLVEKGDMQKVVVGTGPFKFKSYSPGVEVDLIKNPDYFVQGRPYLDGIRGYMLRDVSTRFAAFRTRQVLITRQANGLTPGQAQIARAQLTGATVGETELAAYWLVYMNMRKPPWNDVRVRKAVHLAVDRQSAIRVIEEGFGRIGNFAGTEEWGTPVSEVLKMPGFRPQKDADIAEAKRLLAEAGYPNGFKTSLVFRTPGTFYETGATFIKGQLAAINVDVALEPKETAAYLVVTMGSVDYEMVMHKDAINVPDPDNTLVNYFGSGNPRNLSHYRNSKVDELLQKQGRSLDRAERKALIGEIEKILFDEVPRVQVIWAPYLMGWWNDLRDYRPGATIYTNKKRQDVWLAR